MMDAQRLQMEKMVLARKLPSSAYVFKDMGTSNPYVVDNITQMIPPVSLK